jgi:hypothetical protein
MIKPEDLKVGDILIVNAKQGGFLSSAIRFFSGEDWTHACFLVGDIQNEPMVYEAEIIMANNPVKEYINDTNVDYEIWRLNNVRQDSLDAFAKQVMEDGINSGYGMTALPWFMFRWLQQQISPSSKVIGQRNWFPGKICSEETFEFLIKEASENPPLLDLIKPYNRYTTSPGDLSRLFHKSVLDAKNVIALIDYRVDYKNYPNE